MYAEVGWFDQEVTPQGALCDDREYQEISPTRLKKESTDRSRKQTALRTESSIFRWWTSES
jgi:hypothetical protein